MNSVGNQIKAWALELGFDDCRFAEAKIATHADVFRDWLDEGKNGGMAWLERTPERRVDPREVLPGCKSLICLAVNYYPGEQPEGGDPGYRIARYAWNEDYHDWMEAQLKQFITRLESFGGVHKAYVDTGPVLERDFATDAGLGWNGKSTMQIHRHLGTWFFLAEILTTLDLVRDEPFGDHCGKCTRCMDKCPTGAITAPHTMDARRCISYLTIEHKGVIPVEMRRAIGNRIYGCDACLEACPWNRFAKKSRHYRFFARGEIFENQLSDFLKLDQDQFRQLFAKSPIKRIKRSRFLRNVCVALGNVGGEADLPLLTQAVADTDTLVAEHAQWAIMEIQSRCLGKR